MGTCTSFAALMVSAISYARSTRKSVKTGSKLTARALRLVRALETSTPIAKPVSVFVPKRRLDRHVAEAS
eukprot:6724292-Lingulodinium_polyedra.AAC.1